MDSALKLKGILVLALLIGVGIFGGATSLAKQYYQLRDANFGIDLSYNAESIRCLIRSGDTKKTAAHFVAPILFPIDPLLLVCLGGFLALLSTMAGDAARLPSHWTAVLLVLPVFYMASDLAENTYFTHMLLSPAEAVTDEMVGVAKAISALKLGSAGLAGLQIVSLYFYAGIICAGARS